MVYIRKKYLFMGGIMKKIKLKDYTGEMVCAVSRFKGIKFLYTDQEEEIKTWKDRKSVV